MIVSPMRWQEMTWPEIEALNREATVIGLPVGSVEQHGHHLPLGTDTYLADAVLETAARRLDGHVVILPPPWYGLSTHHMAFPGTITLTARTMMRAVEEIVGSVVDHGFRRLAIVNGHGGNGGVIDVLASILGNRFRGRARIVSLTYFQLAAQEIAELRDSPPGAMGHACEFETAILMHLRPGLVKADRAVTLYPDPGSPYLSTDLLKGSKVRTFLDFRDLSPSGTLGDPALATPEKGERFLNAAAGALARFLDDFRRWPIGDPRQ
jgi:creatinine amidohydrolase